MRFVPTIDAAEAISLLDRKPQSLTQACPQTSPNILLAH
jgi:hypothetical protein